MPSSEQLTQTTTVQTELFSRRKQALTLKIQELMQKDSLFNKTKKLVTGIISFIESRPLWQKIMVGLVLSLPILITGLVLQLSSLMILGACSFVFSSSLIGLLEYYKKQHENEDNSHDEFILTVNGELNQVSEEINELYTELKDYQSVSAGEKRQVEEQLSELNLGKKQLESSLSDLSGRNKILTEIKDSLISENQALRTVVAEKIRLLVQKDQAIKKLEQELTKASQEKAQLLSDLKKYQDLELALSARIKALTEENERLGTKLEQHETHIQQLRTQLSSVLGQRQYLVAKAKEKTKEIDTLILDKQSLERALEKSLGEQEKLKAIIIDLEKDQEQFKQRIKVLNIKLFENNISQEKNQKAISELLNAGTALHQKNEFLTSQLGVLAEQNQFLTETVVALAAIENELLGSKTHLEEVITALEAQTKEQANVLVARKEQLELALNDYQASRVLLDNTVGELALVKSDMAKEVDRFKQTQIILTKTIATLSKAAIKDEDNKNAFLSQLTELIKEKETSFQQVASGVLSVNQRLTSVSQEFEACIERHKSLLTAQEQHMHQLSLLSQAARSANSFFYHPEPSLSVFREPTINTQPIAAY